jgi:hypothetical protein
MVNNPTYTPYFLWRKLANPISLFVTNKVRAYQQTAHYRKLMSKEVVQFIQHIMPITIGNIKLIDDIATRFGDTDKIALYEDATTSIIGIPDVMTDTHPPLNVYYIEHRQLRKTLNVLNRQDKKVENVTPNNPKVFESFLAEGLLLLTAVDYASKNCYNTNASLVVMACTQEMVNLLQPHFESKLILHIADITALPYIHEYLAIHNMDAQLLKQKNCNLTLFDTIHIEQDGSCLLYWGVDKF